MTLSDVTSGCKATVKSRDSKHIAIFDTETVEISEVDKRYISNLIKDNGISKYCCIKTIFEDSMIINFMTRKVLNSITIVDKDEQCYEWPDISIVRVNLPNNGLTHIILSNADVSAFNRRHEPRVTLTGRVVVNINGSKVDVDGEIRDISEHGVGIIISQEHEIYRGDTLDIAFYCREDKNAYKFEALVLRTVNIGKKSTRVGARILDKNSESIRSLIKRLLS